MYGIKPEKPPPELVVDTLDQANWRLSDQRPALFTLIVFYRGLFCATCRDYLREVHAHMDAFQRRGVEVIAISMDTREDAAQARTEWGIDELTIGYGMSTDEADNWGLFISGHGNPQHPERVFSQPGLFLIRPDRSIYAVFVQSSEFARPSMDRILAAIDFLLPDSNEEQDESG